MPGTWEAAVAAYAAWASVSLEAAEEEASRGVARAVEEYLVGANDTAFEQLARPALRRPGAGLTCG